MNSASPPKHTTSPPAASTTATRTSNTSSKSSVSCSAPSLPRLASRSDSAVKPETSANTSAPWTILHGSVPSGHVARARGTNDVYARLRAMVPVRARDPSPSEQTVGETSSHSNLLPCRVHGYTVPLASRGGRAMRGGTMRTVTRSVTSFVTALTIVTASLVAAFVQPAAAAVRTYDSV